MNIFSKIKSFFRRKPDKKIEIVDRNEFAEEMLNDFKGNTELLKAIEECMNRKVKPHQRISLTN